MSPTGCVGMSTVATAMTMTVMMMYQAAFADSAVKHSSHTAQHIPLSHSKHKLPVTITGQTGSSCPGPCPKGFLQDKQKSLSGSLSQSIPSGQTKSPCLDPCPKGFLQDKQKVLVLTDFFRTNKKSLSGSLSQSIPSGQTKSPCLGPCPKVFLQDKQKVVVWILVPKDSFRTNKKSLSWSLSQRIPSG